MTSAPSACVLTLETGRPPFLSQQLLSDLEVASLSSPGGGRNLAFAADVGSLLPGKKALEAHATVPGSRGLKTFVGLSDSISIVANTRSGLLQPPDSSVSSGNKANGAVVFTTAAMERVSLSCEEYLSFSRDVLRAPTVVSPYETVGCTYSRKHKDRAQKRVDAWSESALKWWAATPQQEENGAAKLLLPVVGLDVETQERSMETAMKLVQEHGAQMQVKPGYSLVNLRFLDQESQVARIKEARAQAGKEAFIYAQMGTGPVEELIAAIAAGADAVETALPLMMTKLDCLLCFTVEIDSESPETEAGKYEPSMSLLDQRVSEDKGPLAESCDCWVCRNHTRGYVHHLLKSKELLGQMLLYYHNASMLMRLVDHVARLPCASEREAYVKAWVHAHHG